MAHIDAQLKSYVAFPRTHGIRTGDIKMLLRGKRFLYDSLINGSCFIFNTYPAYRSGNIIKWDNVLDVFFLDYADMKAFQTLWKWECEYCSVGTEHFFDSPIDNLLKISYGNYRSIFAADEYCVQCFHDPSADSGRYNTWYTKWPPKCRITAIGVKKHDDVFEAVRLVTHSLMTKPLFKRIIQYNAEDGVFYSWKPPYHDPPPFVKGSITEKYKYLLDPGFYADCPKNPDLKLFPTLEQMAFQAIWEDDFHQRPVNPSLMTQYVTTGEIKIHRGSSQ